MCLGLCGAEREIALNRFLLMLLDLWGEKNSVFQVTGHLIWYRNEKKELVGKSVLMGGISGLVIRTLNERSWA